MMTTHPVFAGPATVEVPPQLGALVDRLRSAIVAVNNAGSLEHRRARVAAEHLEFELAPLVESLDLEEVVAQIREATVADYKAHPSDVLPLSSEVRLLPRQSAQITTSPQGSGMMIFSISCPKHFVIHDISIGNRSQFAQGGAVRSEDLDGRLLKLDTIHVAMDLMLVVEYVGDNPLGEPFRAAAHGKRF